MDDDFEMDEAELERMEEEMMAEIPSHSQDQLAKMCTLACHM